jgi:hypothetical protein
MSQDFDFFITVAKAAPEELILDLLSDAITAYKADKCEDNTARLRMAVQMMGLRLTTEGESTQTVIKEVSEMTGLMNRLKGKSN